MSKNRSEPIDFGDLTQFEEAKTPDEGYGDGYYNEVYEDDVLAKKARRDAIVLAIAFLVIIALCFVAVITINTLRGDYKPPVLDTSTEPIVSENSKTSNTAPESRIEPESSVESKLETETETTSLDSESNTESIPASNSSTEESKEPESRETIISKPESSTESGQELTSSTIEPESSAEASYFEPESSAETSYFEPESSAETSYFESELEEESLTVSLESGYKNISQEPDFSAENNLEEEGSMIPESEPSFEEDVTDLDPEIPGTQAPG